MEKTDGKAQEPIWGLASKMNVIASDAEEAIRVLVAAEVGDEWEDDGVTVKTVRAEISGVERLVHIDLPKDDSATARGAV